MDSLFIGKESSIPDLLGTVIRSVDDDLELITSTGTKAPADLIGMPIRFCQ
jgi:hypothetical protein